MKLQRNESHEAVRAVLRFAQAHQVVDALFESFHVAEEHGGIRRHADLVRGARDRKPHLPGYLVVANDAPHARMKNLRAAAGKRIDARFFHLQQRVANRKLREARVVVHLDHGEGL